MGNALKDQGRLDKAIEAYNKAISIKPDTAEIYHNMGLALKEQGQLDKVPAAFKSAIFIKPTFAEAHRNLSTVKNYTFYDPHFKQVRSLYRNEKHSTDIKCSLSFALAKMYEDMNQIDEAFEHLTTGNKLRKTLVNYSSTDDKNFFQKIKNAQSNLMKKTLKSKESGHEVNPTFIVGMPRSGTTLVEQILSSHSSVKGGGELDFVQKLGESLATGTLNPTTRNINEFKNKYLSELRKISESKLIITDKMPHNFLFIPLICAAFPKAKIIHVQRNPAATCWSNYKQYFDSTNLGYSYSLKDVVTHYKLYRSFMEFCQSEYSHRIYNLRYEKLTTEQETETKKLIKHMELTWEKACLSPHKNKRIVKTASAMQVRNKVYQGSSAEWERYKAYLNGAFDSLPSL